MLLIREIQFEEKSLLRQNDTFLFFSHLLPSTELEELWESLLYDSNIKEESLRYVGKIGTDFKKCDIEFSCSF